MSASKQQENTNNLQIIMILVTVLVLGVSVFAVKSLWAEITLDNKVIQAKNDANTALDSDVQAAPKLVSAYNGLGDNNRILADALPSEANFSSLIVTLENISNHSGVQLLRSVEAVPTVAGSAAVSAGTTGATGSSQVDPTKPPQPISYKYSINFNTNYPALLKMLGDLELSARPMRFTGLQLNGSGQSLSGQLDVETFYQNKAQLPFGTKEVK
jgi:hypothetical protein